MVTEDVDDVDTESLQAQIDMSMSFAHNLVASWIKPTHHLSQLRSSGANTARIVEEELRRPPRLGVGASIPTAPLAHQASKLKRRLGKSRAKSEDIVKLKPQDSSKSDDEEHKGRPAKRKTKVDPFGHGANSEVNRCPSVEDVLKHPVPLQINPALWESPEHNPSSGKQKQRMGPSGQRCCDLTEGQRSATLTLSPSAGLPVRTTLSSSPATPLLLKPSWGTYGPVSAKTASESSGAHPNSQPLLSQANPLGIPLLNLDGPPELTDKSGKISHLNNPRRKRKRRKKTRMIADAGDNVEYISGSVSGYRNFAMRAA